MLHLDTAATTPLRRDVLEAMWPHLGSNFGNPSSQHELGRSAARTLEEARAQVAEILGCLPGEVVFTGGGTEADNTAVKGIALADPRGRHVIVSAVEHPAVLESAAWLGRIGYAVDIVPVDGHGRVDPDDVARLLRPDTTLVSVQLANNEVGTLQPVAEVSAVAARHGVPVHTDAVQAAGWVDLDLGRLGVRALSLSGHKLGAPKGTGVLVVHRRQRLEPLLHGGGQESGRRSGTVDVAGAVGFAAALTAAAAAIDAGVPAEVARRRDAFVAEVLRSAPGAMLTGHPTERLPGSASFCFPGTSGEAVLLALAERGILCASGSACAAGSDEPSAVLTAMGLSREVAQTAVRCTFGAEVSEDDLARAAREVGAAVTRLRALG
ncbi:cysteine desulfurase family protein [Janibacter sp. G1551]|uniref:cysteine desulfurase family protein n=1 Tax=Janibacter sp. G1551 TaxID=3420440 RepID=UPI003D052BA1